MRCRRTWWRRSQWLGWEWCLWACIAHRQHFHQSVTNLRKLFNGFWCVKTNLKCFEWALIVIHVLVISGRKFSFIYGLASSREPTEQKADTLTTYNNPALFLRFFSPRPVNSPFIPDKQAIYYFIVFHQPIAESTSLKVIGLHSSKKFALFIISRFNYKLCACNVADST